MNKKFDILVVGELNVDIILNRLEGFPALGKEILSEDLNLTLGSSSAIFASNISTLGARVTFAGKLGNDSFGQYLLGFLQQKNVNTGSVKYSLDKATGVTVVLNYGNERAMVTYPGAFANLTIADIEDNMLLSARHLHVSSIFLQQGLKKDLVLLLKRARKLGLSTSVDPQWDPAEIWDINLSELLSFTDVFLPNMAELKALTQQKSNESAINYIKQFNGIIAIKDGENGAYLWDGNQLHHQPAFAHNDVVDTIGAGDSFDAGFIYNYISDKNGMECLGGGVLMGALNTTASGGTAAFENLDTIKRKAGTLFNQKI